MSIGYTSPIMEPAQQPHAILVASHPRSGTHLLIDFLRHNFRKTSIRKAALAPLDHLYLNIERTTSANRHFDEQRQAAILKAAPNPILKTHYDARFAVSWTEDETGVLPASLLGIVESAAKLYIYRNPAKVMTSYFSLMRETPGFTSAETTLDFALEPHWTGLGSRIEWWAEHVAGWLSAPGVTALSYESIVRGPSETVKRLEAAIGLDANPNQVPLPVNRKSVARGRLSRLLPGRPVSTAIVPRHKGPPNALDLEQLLDKAPERVSALCQRLGYG